MPKCLNYQEVEWGHPARVIIGEWSTSRLASQNLMQQAKKRANWNGKTQTGKHDPEPKIGEKI